MKVINNLVVVEVPRKAKHHYVVGKRLGYTDKPAHKMDYQYQDLPFPCTIIGLYRNATHIQIREAYDAAGKAWAGSIWNWLDMPSDTTDLLFLKRI